MFVETARRSAIVVAPCERRINHVACRPVLIGPVHRRLQGDSLYHRSQVTGLESVTSRTCPTDPDVWDMCRSAGERGIRDGERERFSKRSASVQEAFTCSTYHCTCEDRREATSPPPTPTSLDRSHLSSPTDASGGAHHSEPAARSFSASVFVSDSTGTSPRGQFPGTFRFSKISAWSQVTFTISR